MVLLGFPLFCRHFGRFWGLGTQIHHLSFSTPNGPCHTPATLHFKGKCPILKQKKSTIKRGKRQKDIVNGSVFTHVHVHPHPLSLSFSFFLFSLCLSFLPSFLLFLFSRHLFLSSFSLYISSFRISSSSSFLSVSFVFVLIFPHLSVSLSSFAQCLAQTCIRVLKRLEGRKLCIFRHVSGPEF